MVDGIPQDQIYIDIYNEVCVDISQGFDYSYCYLDQRLAHEFYPDHLWKNYEKVMLNNEKYSHDIFAEEALNFIDSQYNADPLKKFFLLNLPVGTGKSHLALMISEWYRKNVNRTARVDVITNSKILQDQYADTYESISDLKGKDNYECVQYSCSCAQGAEFNRLNKTSCESCPYSNARESYMSGGLSLTNFYLYILYAMYNPKLMENRGARVLIVDEAHDFDDVMSDFVSIRMTEGIIKKFTFADEKSIIKNLKSVSNISQYVSFLRLLGSEITSTIESMENGINSKSRNVREDKRDLKLNKLFKSKNSDVKLMQLVSDLKQYQVKIELFLKEYKENPNNWVLESGYNEKLKQKELSLEPIWAYDYLDKYVFSNYDMVVLMSGTILDKSLFCQLNGLDVSKAVYYSIRSPFNPKNRPIFYMPLGKMSYKSKEEMLDSWESGWNCLFKALASITENDLQLLEPLKSKEIAETSKRLKQS